MKVLVANRGEIAVRVIRALKEMDFKSVAVYSEEDRSSSPVAMADEAWCLGASPAKESYLNIGRILTAARLSGAQAVHPGYGFLSENDVFASACEDAGLIFIGPKGSVMANLANKAETKRLVKKAGVSVIPGSEGPLGNAQEAMTQARETGYPVLLKASFGGGGRGIYLVRDEGELSRAYQMAQSQANAAVGKKELYLEKFLENTRHVEVQVALDIKSQGQAFVERDCTIQRRNQKLIEESPSPFLGEQARAKLLEAGLRAAQACGISTLATVEFLLMSDRKTFYFMEINKRIQVEHPVTEELLGIDLVQLQIALAMGQRWAPVAAKSDARHAIEARINAEDPAQNFLPSEGVVTACQWPGGPGIRVDTYLTPYSTLGVSYDSLAAKIIASSPHGRSGAVARMRRALGELKLEGFSTTASLHQELFADSFFAGGEQWFSTRFLEEWLGRRKFN